MPKVKEVGAKKDQPAADADGVVADSVTRYPVTAALSETAKPVIDTVKEVEVDGMVKAITVGGSTSLMTVEALVLAETLPAASLAQP